VAPGIWGLSAIEHMFEYGSMAGEALFELRRRTFDTPHFRGIEFIEAEAKTIINHVPGNYLPFNWTINPYRGCSHSCSYCFARVTHTYMDMNAGRDFERKIVVKVNAPDLLPKELRAKRWKGEHIAMGTATDPYQRAEGRYKLMPRIIETLTEFRNPFSILTKGTLILRDLDLLADAAEKMEVSTALSIGTLDEDVWAKSEPGTPSPRARLDAVAKLNAAGIPCGVMVAPILPGISDSPEQIKEVVTAAIDAGATHVSPILLHLRPVVKDVYMEWLEHTYPDLVPRYKQMYARSAYASSGDKRALSEQVSSAIDAAGGLRPAPRKRPSTRWHGRAETEAERLKSEQLALL
jgi:DNA repair photolyase